MPIHVLPITYEEYAFREIRLLRHPGGRFEIIHTNIHTVTGAEEVESDKTRTSHLLVHVLVQCILHKYFSFKNSSSSFSLCPECSLGLNWAGTFVCDDMLFQQWSH